MEPSLKDLARFEQWKSDNEDVLLFMSFCYPQHPQESKQEIQEHYKKRKQLHDKIVTQLKQLRKSIDSEFANILSKIKLEVHAFPKFSRIFDDQNLNFEARKLLYINQKLKNMVKKYYDGIQPYINQKIQYIEMMSSLFSQNIVPKECVVTVYPEFFKINYEQQLLFKIRSINALGKIILKKLAEATKPLWVSDFNSYFGQLVDEGNQMLNAELFYFSRLPSEISFSRYLFSSRSREGHAMDLFIVQSANLDFKNFPKRVVTFLMAMIKELKVPKDKQSTALLLLYRLLMDRIYETNVSYFEPSKDAEKLWEFSTYPISKYTLPPKMVKITDPNESIRDCFLKDSEFQMAADAMNIVMFTINPIDVLYNVHNSMVMIHKAAITNLNNKTPTDDDLKHLLSFDDLFSLLLGTTLASDIPDIQAIGRVMKTFAPYDCMSPQLEYANSNLEAIILYLTSPS